MTSCSICSIHGWFHWFGMLTYSFGSMMSQLIFIVLKPISTTKHVIHKLQVLVFIVYFDTNLDNFENCICNNEIPSDQDLDWMMALTFPQVVCNTIFLMSNKRQIIKLILCIVQTSTQLFNQIDQFCLYFQGIEQLLEGKRNRTEQNRQKPTS